MCGSEGRRIGNMGVDGGCPVKAVIGATLLHCGDCELLISLLTSGVS